MKPEGTASGLGGGVGVGCLGLECERNTSPGRAMTAAPAVAVVRRKVRRRMGLLKQDGTVGGG